MPHLSGSLWKIQVTNHAKSQLVELPHQLRRKSL